MQQPIFVLGLFGFALGQQANCVFEGDGTGEVVGEIILTEFGDGSEIE